MGFFSTIFGGKRSSSIAGQAPDKIKWIKAFAKKRVVQDPLAIPQGFSADMIEQLPPAVLLGLPEGTLVSIVESFAAMTRNGASDIDALKRIEARRESMISSGTMPTPLSLESYVGYRIRLEHSDGAPIAPEHISECLLMARTLYRC